MIVGRKRIWLAFAVGAFISFALLGFMVLIVVQGGARNIFEQHFLVRARLTDATGLVPGAPVRMLGLRVGSVHVIELSPDNSVTVSMNIEEAFRGRIRFDESLYPNGPRRPPRELQPEESSSGSLVTIQNPGLIGLGDLSLVIVPATGEETSAVQNGMFLPVRPYVDPAAALIRRVSEIARKLETQGTIADLLADGGKLYRNLQSAVEEADKLLTSVNRPDNSVARLLSDEGGLYRNIESSTADLKEVAREVREEKLAEKIDELIRKVGELADSLKATAEKIGRASDDLPSVVGEAEHTLDAAGDAAEAVKRHWLINSYVAEESVPALLQIRNRRNRYDR